MKLADPKSPATWAPDPLLGSRAQKNGFAQSPWDKSQAKKQEAWRSDSEIAAQEPSPKPVLKPELDAAAPATPTDSANDKAELDGSTPGSQGLQTHAHSAGQDQIGQNLADVDAVLSVSAAQIEQQVRVGRQQGYVQGLKDGMAKTLMELQADRQAEKDLIQQVSQELGALQQDAFRLFEPLRKLSLHIAEQLVRGELSLSGLAVERLVKACLAEITLDDQAVMVYAHPQDLDKVRPLLQASGAALKLVADPQLLQGSVRVRSNDTVIEDLIQHRLESLAQKLIFESDDWIRNASNLAGLRVETVESASVEAPMAMSKFEVEDVEDKTIPTETDRPDPTTQGA